MTFILRDVPGLDGKGYMLLSSTDLDDKQRPEVYV